MINEFILQNWALILILAAFAIALKETIFLDRQTIRRMYALIAAIFVLSVVVFAEFWLADHGAYRAARTALMAVRYSATPFIIAQAIYSLNPKSRWIIFIPAMLLAVVDFLSIPTGIVFRVNADGTFERGVLGYLPFTMVGAYAIALIAMLLRRSNKRPMEIIPIVFLAFALAIANRLISTLYYRLLL